MSIKQKRVRSEFDKNEELDNLLSEGWLIIMSFPFQFEEDIIFVEYILEKQLTEVEDILNNASLQ